MKKLELKKKDQDYVLRIDDEEYNVVVCKINEIINWINQFDAQRKKVWKDLNKQFKDFNKR